MSILTVPTTKKISSFASTNSSLSVLDISATKKKISIEERATLLLMRDLVRLGWRLKSNSSKYFEFSPPYSYEKNVIKDAMVYARNEIIDDKSEWIENHISLGQENLAIGKEVLKSEVIPRIEICT